jgi:hypothetical protein
MTIPTLPIAIVDALRSAGATVEMIAAAEKAYGEFGDSPRPRGGRPRKYAGRAECDRAYRERKKAREETCEETCEETPAAEAPREETHEETPPVPRDQILYRYANERLLAALTEAARGNFDPFANLEPIRDLIQQGCDLEQDVVPVVAGLIPELPRPLKNWGATWLVRDILAARDQRLTGKVVAGGERGEVYEFEPVEAPPPVQRTPAIAWDEFVAGHRSGLIEWNRARLGPYPGEPGCRAPADVLSEHGFRPSWQGDTRRRLHWPR